jgi:hypothetical protein
MPATAVAAALACRRSQEVTASCRHAAASQNGQCRYTISTPNAFHGPGLTGGPAELKSSTQARPRHEQQRGQESLWQQHPPGACYSEI